MARNYPWIRHRISRSNLSQTIGSLNAELRPLEQLEAKWRQVSARHGKMCAASTEKAQEHFQQVVDDEIRLEGLDKMPAWKLDPLSPGPKELRFNGL